MINYVNCCYSSLKVIHDMDFFGGGLLGGGGGIYISTSFWSLKYLLSNKYDIKPRHLSEDYFRESWCDFENGCKIVSRLTLFSILLFLILQLSLLSVYNLKASLCYFPVNVFVVIILYYSIYSSLFISTRMQTVMLVIEKSQRTLLIFELWMDK